MGDNIDKESRAETSVLLLESALSGGFQQGVDERFGAVIARDGLWDEAMELAFSTDAHVAFRASWAIEWAYFHNRESFRPQIARFAEVFLQATNRSVHRHYTKMMCDMLRRGLFEPDDPARQSIAERSFDLLVDPQTKVAVKVWCEEILFELSPRVEWVAECLYDVVALEIERMPTPAMLNHGRKMLKRIASR